jgi:hypothetical protein
MKVSLVGFTLVGALVACSGDRTASDLTGVPAGRSARAAQTSFVVGPLGISGIAMSFPGGNWHLRDVTLSGPVSGELAGTADVVLNADMDEFLGSGPAWGTMRIVTSGGDVWAGNLQGHFENGAPNGIQLFSSVVLHGANGQLIRAECDETTVTSETLDCTGTKVNGQ